MAGAKVFDVVVVGGGAAGCVTAARLAESPSRSVLLLEAGPDLRANLPEAFRDGWRLCRDLDWGYVSEPDARGLVEQLRRPQTSRRDFLGDKVRAAGSVA